MADPDVFIVDTHALVWHLGQSPNLGRAAACILSDPGSELVIPSIVLAEARYLSAKKPPRVSWEEVLLFLRSARQLSIFPLDEETISELPVELEMQDAIVCAAAAYWRDVLLRQPAVLTKDGEIVKSGLIKTLW